jgi:hypothetical protein
MKKIIPLFLGALLLLSAAQAGAQPRFTQNKFTTAESIDMGMTQAGIQFSLADHYKSYYPEFRYGLGSMLEAGVKLGAAVASIDSSDSLGILLGGDIKYQLIKETEGVPVDMAVDLGLNNTIMHSKNATELSFSTIFSKGFPLTDRGTSSYPMEGSRWRLYAVRCPKTTLRRYTFSAASNGS